MSRRLETYFSRFRVNVIGQQVYYDTPFGSGAAAVCGLDGERLGLPPDRAGALLERVLPFFGNTHSETSVVGTRMSAA